jgi:hypothetical protein
MVRPADLTVRMGNGDDTLLVDAHNGFENPTTMPWHIDVTGGGVERSTFLLGGQMGNLDLEEHLAEKKSTVDVSIDPSASVEAVDSFLKMNFFGAGGADTVHAVIGPADAATEGPGPINRVMLETAVDLSLTAGGGMETLSVEYHDVTIAAPQTLEMTGVQSGDTLHVTLQNALVSAPLAVAWSGPGDDSGSTAVAGAHYLPFPLDGSLTMTDRGGQFEDDVRVIYAFNPVPEPPGKPSDLRGAVEFDVPHGDLWGVLFEFTPPPGI